MSDNNIPITVEVPKADVWLRNDYRDIVHRLGEVHLVRACEHQHDDDFVPMYDSQTLAEYQKKAESLRLECERAWAEVDRIAKQIGEMTTERIQDQLTHGNIMGRIAVALFGRQNNVTDEECVAEAASVGYRMTALYQRIKQLQDERNTMGAELRVWQDRYQKVIECWAQAKAFEPIPPIIVEAGSQMAVGVLRNKNASDQENSTE